eukprot:365612-Chlamydomonas_euryale.AAC.6
MMAAEQGRVRQCELKAAERVRVKVVWRRHERHEGRGIELKGISGVANVLPRRRSAASGIVPATNALGPMSPERAWCTAFPKYPQQGHGARPFPSAHSKGVVRGLSQVSTARGSSASFLKRLEQRHGARPIQVPDASEASCRLVFKDLDFFQAILPRLWVHHVEDCNLRVGMRPCMLRMARFTRLFQSSAGHPPEPQAAAPP